MALDAYVQSLIMGSVAASRRQCPTRSLRRHWTSWQRARRTCRSSRPRRTPAKAFTETADADYEPRPPRGILLAEGQIWSRPVMVSMKEIRAVGRRIGREFQPQRVILFGSHAHGTAGRIPTSTCW